MKTPIKLTISTFKKRFRQDFIAAALFGSRARKGEIFKSDWDLFLIIENIPKNPFDRQLLLREILPKDASKVSLLPKTKVEFESDFPPLYLDLAIDGTILHDTNNYLRSKLEEIKRILKKTGLKREKIRQGWIWKWERYPKGRWRIDWEGIYGLESGSKL